MSKKVLLADDSVTIQRVVEIILADGDYDLLIADNGDAALNKAQADRPDIVLADIYMPGKDGYQLCAAVKQDGALSGIPVLLLSGTFEAFDESKALAAGADGWIAKPFESQALLEQMEELLARPAAATALTEAPDAASAAEAAASVAEPDMWADIEIDTLAEDQSEEFLVDATAGPEDSVDEVELEADSLWDEEPLLGSDDQPVALADEEEVEVGEIDFTELAEPATASDELTLAEDAAELVEAPEEVLFLDESDLLIEDDAEPVTIAEEETFEFVTLEESTTATEEVASESFQETPAAADDTDLESQPAEAVAEPAAAEEPAPEAAEEVVADIFPEPEVADETVAAAEPELPMEPESALEPEPVTAPAEPAVSGLGFFRNSGLIARLAGGEEAEPVAEVAAEEQPVSPEPPAAPVTKEAVVERVQGLSEQELTAIVEQVAGKVIERLASTMLEKIAWEVVPDLAESLIKEEISRITAGQD